MKGKEKIKNIPTTKIKFTKEEMQQVENMEKYSTPLVIKEMQIKMMDYFFTNIKVSKLLKVAMFSLVME